MAITVERNLLLRLMENASRFLGVRGVFIRNHGDCLQIETYDDNVKFSGEVPVQSNDDNEKWRIQILDPKALITMLKKDKKEYFAPKLAVDGEKLCVWVNCAYGEFGGFCDIDPPGFEMPDTRKYREYTCYLERKSADIAVSLKPAKHDMSVVTSNVMFELERELLVSTELHTLYASAFQFYGDDTANQKCVLIDKDLLANVLRCTGTDKTEPLMIRVLLEEGAPFFRFYIDGFSELYAVGKYGEIPGSMLSLIASNNEKQKHPINVTTGELVTACRRMVEVKANALLRRASFDKLECISYTDENTMNVIIPIRPHNDLPDGIDDVLVNPKYLLTLLKHSKPSYPTTLYFAKEKAGNFPIGVYNPDEYLSGIIMPMRQ